MVYLDTAKKRKIRRKKVHGFTSTGINVRSIQQNRALWPNQSFEMILVSQTVVAWKSRRRVLQYGPTLGDFSFCQFDWGKGIWLRLREGRRNRHGEDENDDRTAYNDDALYEITALKRTASGSLNHRALLLSKIPWQSFFFSRIIETLNLALCCFYAAI